MREETLDMRAINMIDAGNKRSEKLGSRHCVYKEHRVLICGVGGLIELTTDS